MTHLSEATKYMFTFSIFKSMILLKYMQNVKIFEDL